MKKLIAMISAIAVICTMSLTSFAEITVTPNPDLTTAVTLEKGESGGYDASYESAEVNTQTTIVAVKGTEINTSSIQYINQLTQDSEEVINFDLKDTLAAGEIVTVYMGGDAINKTKIGTITKAAEVQTYNVTFTVDGETHATQTCTAGTTPTAPTAPEKSGYNFIGWKLTTEADSAARTDFSNDVVNSDLTFVAVFEEIQSGGEDTETVTISYQMVKVDISSTTADTTVSTADLNSGDVIYTSMTEPTLSKYAFVGWYTDSALTTKLDKTATATVDTTIYAKMAKIYKYGDANNDVFAAVNSADATAIMQWLGNNKPSTSNIGKALPGVSKTKYGDANGDVFGAVNSADATAIMQWLGNNKPATSIINTNITITKD